MNDMHELSQAMDISNEEIITADSLPPPSSPHPSSTPKRKREDEVKYDPSADDETVGAADDRDDSKPINVNLFTNKPLFAAQDDGETIYEESVDWSLTENKGVYNLVGPDHVPRPCISALDLLEGLLSHCPDINANRGLLDYVKTAVGQAELEAAMVSPVHAFTHVKKGDVKKLKASTTTAAQQKAKKALDALKAYRSKDTVHGGANLKKHPSEFLEEYSDKLWDYDVWLANKAASFDFEAEQAKLTQASSVADIESSLKEYIRDHDKTQMESLKGAYFIGRCVNFIRAKGVTKWKHVCKRLECSEPTLRGKERLFMFLNEFRLFLRVPLSFTTLLKYSKDLVKHFDGNHEAAAKWRDLKWGVPDAHR